MLGLCINAGQNRASPKSIETLAFAFSGDLNFMLICSQYLNYMLNKESSSTDFL